jgi:hypothetical protein
LAARQFAWPHIGFVGKADALERRGDSLHALSFRLFGKPEADIVGDPEPGQEPRLLKNYADLCMRRADPLVIQDHRAFAWRIESGDGAQ